MMEMELELVTQIPWFSILCPISVRTRPHVNYNGVFMAAKE